MLPPPLRGLEFVGLANPELRFAALRALARESFRSYSVVPSALFQATRRKSGKRSTDTLMPPAEHRQFGHAVTILANEDRILPRVALNSGMTPNYNDFLIKRFEQPDEVRTFEKGYFEIVKIGSMTIGRASYEPGWKWSKHVGLTTGAVSCEVEHVGLVISGSAACQMNDGRYYEMKAGDLFYIGPGHDSWVVGNQPYVSLHFLGAEHYAGLR